MYAQPINSYNDNPVSAFLLKDSISGCRSGLDKTLDSSPSRKFEVLKSSRIKRINGKRMLHGILSNKGCSFAEDADKDEI